MRDGKIEAVGADVKIPSDARVVDAAGQSIFPGFFDANCHVGLSEIDQVTSSVDSSESVDPVTPQMKVTDGFFPESLTIAVTRSNGVTSGIVAPDDVKCRDVDVRIGSVREDYFRLAVRYGHGRPAREEDGALNAPPRPMLLPAPLFLDDEAGGDHASLRVANESL